jgi:hypothetical protein
MSGATQLDRERLAKLCGLFGSDHAGERANAAAVADRLVRQAGLRWLDVVLPAPPRFEREIKAVRDAAEFCRRHPQRLSPWERQFLDSIADRPGRLSDKQAAVLARLGAKIRAAERAAKGHA